jgi:hypothetical protein
VVLVVATMAVAVSCKNEYESNLQKMELAAKKYVEDMAFKNNATIDFLEFKAVSCDTVDENHIDTLLLIKLADMTDRYMKLNKLYIDRAKNNMDLLKIYASLEMRDVALDQYKEVESGMETVQLYRDSVEMCLSMDTMIRERIKSRINPKVFYRTTLFIKATSKNNKSGASENYMDNRQMYFDEKINIFKIPTPTL